MKGFYCYIMKKMEVLKSKEVKLYKLAKLKFLYQKSETKIFIVLSWLKTVFQKMRKKFSFFLICKGDKIEKWLKYSIRIYIEEQIYRHWQDWEEILVKGMSLRSVTTEMGGIQQEVGGRLKRERTYVYLQLSHVDVWQKPAQYCKAIILQLQTNLKTRTRYIPVP